MELEINQETAVHTLDLKRSDWFFNCRSFFASGKVCRVLKYLHFLSPANEISCNSWTSLL